MTIPINLASEPFRRDRPMIIASASVGVLLALLLAVLVWLAMAERDNAGQSRELIARSDGQLRTMATEQAKLEAVLRRPENAEVLDRNRFVNELLLRKAISWTRIFSDLEKVVPHNVRLISVRPQLTINNELLLDMQVGAQSSEPVLRLLRELEASPLFGTTAMHNWLPPSQSEPLYRYSVSVSYAQRL